MLGNGLLTSEGDFHLRQRRMMQPAFHRRRVAAYAGIMAEEAVRVGDAWREGEARDVAADMTQLALRVVTRALFGAELDADAERIGRAVAEVGEFFDYLTIALLPVLLRTPLPAGAALQAGHPTSSRARRRASSPSAAPPEARRTATCSRSCSPPATSRATGRA